MAISGRQGLKYAFLTFVVVFIGIQFVPYGHDHTNPPVIKEPVWDSPETSRLVHAACYDCHSNETKYPFYASIAPSSWLVLSDIHEGRRHVNFSEWNRRQSASQEAPDMVRKGDMPLWQYRLAHAAAQLSPADRERLALGLEKSLGLK
jgi:hypothetical protein